LLNNAVFRAKTLELQKFTPSPGTPGEGVVRSSVSKPQTQESSP
jgi:hypothetical protein